MWYKFCSYTYIDLIVLCFPFPRVLKDRELETRIKNHIKKIREERRSSQTVSDEVEEAKSNLELVSKEILIIYNYIKQISAVSSSLH